MTISGRLAMLFRAKASKVLDRAEDPRETLDYSYQKQLELLLVGVGAWPMSQPAGKRLEPQAEQLASSAGKLQQHASQAVSAGRARPGGCGKAIG